MIKLERVVKRKNCGFCNGQMQCDDFQVVEKIGTSRRTWCLKCGRMRMEDRKKELDLMMKELDSELSKRPDRYVMTAMSGK